MSEEYLRKNLKEGWLEFPFNKEDVGWYIEEECDWETEGVVVEGSWVVEVSDRDEDR